MFGKKKSSGLPFPLEKIKTMSKMGIGEKEIVKQLKSEGYTFSEIEQAMMQAMKEGVESRSRAPQMQTIPQSIPPQSKQASDGDIGLSWPELERPEELFPELQEQDEIAPEVAMEDLIENITYEKFDKYNKELKSLTNSLNEFKQKINNLEVQLKNQPSTDVPKEFEDRIESMEAKVNGLERAFRQILPSITKKLDELKTTIEHVKKTPVSAQLHTAVPDQKHYQQYYPKVPLFPTKTISKDSLEKKPVEKEAQQI